MIKYGDLTFNPFVRNHEVRKATQVILQTIKTILDAFLDAHTKQVVMQRVLVDLIVIDVVANSTTCSKDTLAQKDPMYGLVQLLAEMKVAKTLPSMVTKHAILMTLMNKSYTSSLKQKVWVLNMHPRNVTMALCHKESMQTSRKFLWSSSIQKKRKDMLAHGMKAIVLSWWVENLHESQPEGSG